MYYRETTYEPQKGLTFSDDEDETMDSSPKRVLVVEDQEDIGALIALNLESLNYEVKHCMSGRTASAYQSPASTGIFPSKHHR